jgi:hypothetical protein
MIRHIQNWTYGNVLCSRLGWYSYDDTADPGDAAANFIIIRKIQSYFLIFTVIVTYIVLVANVSTNKVPAMDWTSGVKIPLETMGFLSSSQSERL